MTSDSQRRLAHAVTLAELQNQIDALEQVAPLSKIGRFVVGGLIACMAQLLIAGGLSPDDHIAELTLWVLASACWAYVLVGGYNFLLARMKVGTLRRALATRLDDPAYFRAAAQGGVDAEPADRLAASDDDVPGGSP